MIEEPQNSGEVVERNKDGTFKDGHPKLGGRTSGTKNYDTEMDEAIEAYAKLNNLTPDEVKLRIYMKGAGEALKGVFPFFKDYMDRRHGTAQNNLKLSGEVTTKKVVSIDE